jgi:hypothetical protein
VDCEESQVVSEVTAFVTKTMLEKTEKCSSDIELRKHHVTSDGEADVKFDS